MPTFSYIKEKLPYYLVIYMYLFYLHCAIRIVHARFGFNLFLSKKLLKKLFKEVENCVDVPKEVCVRSQRNPRTVAK